MPKEKVEYYDQNWQEYDNWYDSHPALYESELSALKNAIPLGVGLEIGVGTGRFASPLCLEFGLDPSFNMLKLAEQRGVTVIQGIGENLPFKNESFNFALIVLTIWLVDNPLRVLREAVRVLKKRGELILGILDRESSWGKFYMRKAAKSSFYSSPHFFSPEEILLIFKDISLEFDAAFQTLIQPPPDIQYREKPEKGYGQGGFVVLKAIKK
jgi:SAM-dependent methyltransferase